MKRNINIFTIILFLTFMITIGSISAFSIERIDPPVSPMYFGIHEIGTGGHAIVSTILEGINEMYPDLVIRTIPSGIESVRSYLARTGEVHVGFGQTFVVNSLQEGFDIYSNREWGPQPVSYVYISQSPGKGFAVRADSDIYTFDDLKGKRVASMKLTYPSIHEINTTILRFGGLTWDDVVPVQYASTTEAYKAVIDGRIETTMFNIKSSSTFELEAVHGIRWLAMPAEDEESWGRAKEYQPIYSPITCTEGAGISEENPIDLLSEGYPLFFAYDHLDEDIAYWIARAIDESREYYLKRDPSLEKLWTIEAFLRLWDDDRVPMNNGTIRYLEEIGYWTSERDQMNGERIARQELLKNVWEEATIEAEKQGIKSKDFPDFWLAKRAEAGL